jgi:ABC-type sugar transport system ATPase subunit
MSIPAINAQGVCKRFEANVALDHVDFDVHPGEIHAIVGENGAGKSTLIRILGGVHRPDRASIFVAGRARTFASPHDAIAAGIVTIPQELRLVPALSVAENISLGDQPLRRFGPVAFVDRGRMRELARAVLSELDFHPDPNRSVASLSFAERQIVAIAKGLAKECRVFILDEPTAALERREVERLFAVLARMQMRGTAVIYISHELDEVVAIADRCTVLRDGRVVAVKRRGTFSANDLVDAMTGGLMDDAPHVTGESGDVLLAAKADGVNTVELRAGIIMGFAGLLGSGAEGILRRLFGLATPTSVEIRGKKYRFKNPANAIAAGIGMVPGERSLGLVMSLSVRDNIVLPNLDFFSRIGWFDIKAADRMASELMARLDIRPRNPELKAHALSGGNQQKVILAKWLARRIAVLLLQEPTQGIDVAAKAQIHALIKELAGRGSAAVVNSTDLAELIRLCDAVCAVRRDRIVATLRRDAALDEAKLRSAIGA